MHTIRQSAINCFHFTIVPIIFYSEYRKVIQIV